MSQSGRLRVTQGVLPPMVPIQFTTDSGIAVPALGNLNVFGVINAAGTDPFSTSGVGDTLNINIQTSQAIGATNASNIGLAAFNSAQFTVDANGFVSTSGTGVANTITGDTGGALSPTAGNWNILGGPGVTTTGSGSTLTINSVVFTDTTATTLAVDNGYFATAAGTYNMPATAAQGEVIEIVCDTAGAVVLDCPANNLIRIGNQITSSGGTATSNDIGDSLKLRYRLSSLTWHAISVVGNWTLA